jgi:outer membrane lipoprotein SlyB
MRRRGPGKWSLVGALAAAAFAAAAAHAQSYSTLRMPDFREPFTAKKLSPGEQCIDCGRVQAVREIALERRTAVPTTFQGSSRGIGDTHLVGAVLYLPLSSSSSDKPFVGGVGTHEMRERFGESTYAVTVKLDDQSMRVVHRADGSRFHVGDRVRVIGSTDLELMAE